MELAKNLLSCEASSLLLTDLKSGDLIFNTVTGDKQKIIQGERIPKGKGIAGEVALSGKSVIVNDVRKDKRFFEEIDKKSNFVTRNVICVPMLIQDDLVGVLEIVNTIQKDHFDDSDMLKADLIAEHAAIAIDSRRLQDEMSRRMDELSALYEVSQTISFSNIYDENIFFNILKTLSRFIGAEKSSIFILDNTTQKLQLKASYGLSATINQDNCLITNNSVSTLVFKSKDPMIVTDINEELPPNVLTHKKGYKTKSFISVPVIHKTKAIGVLNMADKKNKSIFDSFDLRVLSTVGNLISDTYFNIENQKYQIDRKRLEREIDIAAEIQRKILPSIPSNYGKHQLAAFNHPAKVVGGDFYDFVKFDENKYGVIVADVSGKGIPAAMFMGTARNIVRAETRIHTAPSMLLKESNELIYNDSEHGMYVTLFYALIDSHNKIITYGSAGHNNQILLKKTGEHIKLNSKGKPLGIFSQMKYEEKIALYEEGDILLLFTDGVSECLGGIDLDIELGERRLIETAVKFLDKTPSELVSHLKITFENSEMDDKYRDDFTIFVIKF
ncbi:MAG: SpoIIE family protein phosphatase [Spirochaetes bacterium]|nr:SpoIIE family protein phosphatase [Spirochaetota bacterium]